jgi:hypothetical protein
VSRIITAVTKFAATCCVSGEARASDTAARFATADSRRPTVIATILIAAGAVLVAVVGSALVAPQGDIKS